MYRGFTLAELVVTIAIVALVAGIGLPRLGRTLDWLAADAAARDVSTALFVARSTATMQGVRTRVVIAADTVRLDRWEPPQWVRVRCWPGPAARHVALEVSNPVVVFDPIGLAWGVSNTKVVFRRGTDVEMLTVSSVGRVKRW